MEVIKTIFVMSSVHRQTAYHSMVKITHGRHLYRDRMVSDFTMSSVGFIKTTMVSVVGFIKHEISLKLLSQMHLKLYLYELTI